MKYLQDYRESKQTTLFDDTGSFFAFSSEQFNEAKKEGVKYTNLGAGLICDSKHVDKLVKGLDAINKTAMAQDIADNGIDGIIIRELYNHEAFYTMDIYDAYQTVKQYGISEVEVRKLFKIECGKIDWDNY